MIKFLHTTNTLSVRQYGIIDKTDDLNLLRRWWNFLPINWFNVEELINEITVIVNPDHDSNTATEVGKLIRYNRILLLESLHIGIYNLIVLKPENDGWRITKKKRTNLIQYIKLVKKLTGIEIKDLSGLTKLKEETQRLSDKYIEIYKQDAPKGKRISFLSSAYSYFGIMEMDYNPNLKLSEFEELRNSAIEKTRYIESLKVKK